MMMMMMTMVMFVQTTRQKLSSLQLLAYLL